MKKEFSSVGKNIKKARIEHGLSQNRLAELAGLTGNYIGMIERNEKTLSLESFIAIVNALNTSADKILADVVRNGYTVKESILTERISKLPASKRGQIYDVIDTMLSHTED